MLPVFCRAEAGDASCRGPVMSLVRLLSVVNGTVVTFGALSKNEIFEEVLSNFVYLRTRCSSVVVIVTPFCEL